MIKLITLASTGILAFCTVAHAQQNRFSTDRPVSHGRHNAHRTTVADVAEDQYDVKYLKFDLNVTNTSTAISGSVATTAKVVAPSMPAYVFELDTSYTIDSAKIDGVLYSVTGDSIRSIMLGTPLIAGSTFTAQVFYHGAVTSSDLYSLGGLYLMTDPDWSATTLFTVSEAYHAYRWWPAKQSLRDKIDSVDMWLTVPDSLKAGSNGLLQAVTPVDATHNRYEWKERSPIDYYLISIAVGAYAEYSYYMHFTGSTDSMLMQNYVYDRPGFMPAYKNYFDSTALAVNYLSSLFGLYPFAKEKYGHSIVYWGGAEENQTMTTLGSVAIDMGTISHELGHQWFGDNVTCGTWRDIMMNEGAASYVSYLYYDHFYDHPNALSYMLWQQNYIKSVDTGSVYVDDTTNEGRIFDSRLTYGKGGVVLHTLRSVVNDDSSYFHIFRNYQQANAGGNGTVEDFKNTAKALVGPVVNGINLDTFFNQWVYLQGFPKYAMSWNQLGDNVYVHLAQTTSVPASVSLFKVPLELRLRSAAGDTIVRVLNDQSAQNFHFTWSKTLTGVFMDPNAWLIYKLTANNHDMTLGIEDQVQGGVTITPNPATNGWQVSNASVNSDLTLTDMTGRVLWQYNSGSAQNISIPASELSRGTYVLSIVTPGKAPSVHKLVKE